MDKIETEFVKIYGSITEQTGMDKGIATIFALCNIAAEPLALEELARKTGYSLASVSSKVSTMERIGLLSKTRRPGSHKVFVKSEKDLIKMHRDFGMRNIEAMKLLLTNVDSMISSYSGKKVSPDEKSKLANVEHFYQNVKLVKSLTEEMLISMEKAMQDRKGAK